MVVAKLFIICAILAFVMMIVCGQGVRKTARTNILKYHSLGIERLIDDYAIDNVGKLFSLGLLTILTFVFGFWTIILW